MELPVPQYHHQTSRRIPFIAVDYLGFGLSEHPSDFGYTVEEHAAAVGELLDHLDLDGFITMGQDWGGPISMAIATQRPASVRGVVLGNTWFWPADGWRLKLFSIVMGTWPLQYLVLHRNLFVEFVRLRLLQRNQPMRSCSTTRAVQPSLTARRGIAEFPKQIRAARPLLERLARDVPSRLGSKPALFVWGSKDPAFALDAVLSQLQDAFPDNVLSHPPPAGEPFHSGGRTRRHRGSDHPALRRGRRRGRGRQMSEIPAPSCGLGAPVAMLNALWFRPGGMELYGQYGEAVLPMFSLVRSVPNYRPRFCKWRSHLRVILIPTWWDSSGTRPQRRSTRCGAVKAIGGLRIYAPTLSTGRCSLVVPLSRLTAVKRCSTAAWLSEYVVVPRGRTTTLRRIPCRSSAFVEVVAGRYVLPRFLPDLAYDDDFIPDLVFLGNYPSKEAVFELVTNPAYAEVAEIRTAAVRRSATSILRVP